MKNIHFILLPMFLLVASCKQALNVDKELTAFDNSEKAFKQEIPAYGNGKPDIFTRMQNSNKTNLALIV